MAKIIYSSYHLSSWFSKKALLRFLYEGGVFSIVYFFAFIYIIIINIVFGIQLVAAMLEDINNFWGLFLSSQKEGTSTRFFICLIITATLPFVPLCSHLNFVLTNQNLYLFSPLFPFLRHKIAIQNIDFIRIKTIKISKDEPNTSFMIHLKDNKQLLYSMPWVDNDKLKEKLESLGIPTVIYDFPAKAFT